MLPTINENENHSTTICFFVRHEISCDVSHQLPVFVPSFAAFSSLDLVGLPCFVLLTFVLVLLHSQQACFSSVVV